MELIEYRDVAIQYEPGRPVVRDVNIAMKQGSITAFLGPNGSGKTTMMSALNGMIRPCAGEILVDGRNISHMKRRELGRTIACVPQFTTPSFSYTVADMVMWGRSPYISYKPKSEDYNIVQDALEQFKIGHLAHKPFNSISGGEKQLTLIARAIVQDTPIVLMDEPATYLDLKNQVHILNLILEIRNSRRTTFVITLHDPNHALYVADNAVLVHDGTAEIGPKREVMTRENLESLYQISASFIDRNDMTYMLPDFSRLQ